jgi:hypothetical protein
VYQDNKNLRHILLAAGNRKDDHLIVMRSNTDTIAIKNMYKKGSQSGTIQNPISYFIDPEIVIVGKIVGTYTAKG